MTTSVRCDAAFDQNPASQGGARRATDQKNGLFLQRQTAIMKGLQIDEKAIGVMALQPTSTRPQPRYRLRPFAPEHAGLIASWAQDPVDAEWVAPRTPPPLTADKVLDWLHPGCQPFELAASTDAPPVAYGELNLLRERRREYWLGHLIVDSQQRGKGLGALLTRLLIERALNWHAARRVTLVVFPENAAAVAAYQNAGMRLDGFETHYFEAYDREVQLVRLEVRGKG